MEDTTKISGSLETEAPMNYEASNEQDDPPEKQAPIEVLTEIPVENEAMIDEIDLIENEGSIEVLTETPVENEAMIDEDDIIENEGSIEVQAVTQASIEEEHSNEKEASTEKEASIEEDALAEDEISVSDDVVDSMYDQAINTASVNATPSILEDIENHYVGIRHDRDLLQIQLQEAGDKIKELTQKVLQFQGSEIESANYKNELEIACRKIQSLHEDRKVMQELMDRMQADGDNLREELSRLSKTNTELSQQASNLEMQSKLSGSEMIPLHHEKQRLLTELASLNSHSNWLEQELDSKSKQYQHLQRESRDRSIQLQLQLDETISEKETFSARLNALEKIERNLQDKINQLSLDNLNIKQELSTSRQNFEVELQEECKVINLQKEHIVRWEQRYEDITKENENLKLTATQALEMSEKEKKNERLMLEQKYTSILQDQADEYERKLKELGSSTTGGSRLALPYSTTESAEPYREEDDDGPISMTDLYERLVQSKTELRREQLDRKCWQLQFERVQKDIKEMAPRLIRQREEYEMAVDQLSDYQKRLEMALTEREDAAKEASEARNMAIVLQNRLVERQAEAQELAKQVQSLLVSRSNEQDSADSSHGSIPRSIQDMQSQNQRLLAEHRRLTQLVTDLENKLQTDTLRQELDQSKSEIKTLRDGRKEQEILVEHIVQQRDLYRALLSKHDGNLLGSESDELSALEMTKHQSERSKKLEILNKELESEIKTLRAETSSHAREKDEMSARLQRHEVHSEQLIKSMEGLERDLLSSRGNEARILSEKDYHKDHCERLEGSLERARNEITQVTTAKNELQRINTELQQLLSNTNSERGLLESEKRQFESKLRLLHTQLETSKSAEKRVTEENSQLRADVTRQGLFIDSIRRIEASLLVNNEGEKEVLRKEKDALTERLAEESSRFKIETENWSLRIQQLETSITELNTSKDTINSLLLESQQKLLEATAEIKELTTKCGVLGTQLAVAKKKNGEGEETDEDVALQSKIDKLESEIEALRAEKDAASETAENYKKMAKDNEKALADVQILMDQIQSEKSAENDTLKNQLGSLRNTSKSKDVLIEDLTNDLANHRDEREKVVEELKNNVLSLEAQIQNNEKDVQSAKATSAALSYDMEALRDELKVAQNNFEHELGQHSQARTALRAAREEADNQVLLRTAAEEKVKEIQKELKENSDSWELERIASKQTIELLEKRMNDSQDQNTLLHTQLDSLNEMVTKSQESRISAVGEIEGPLGNAEFQKVSSELREIVKFLRSENEIIQIQLDTAKRVADREKAASNVLRRSLDEAEVELKLIRSEIDQPIGEVEKSVVDIEDKLKGNEQQLILLKDSNTLLREEVEKLEIQLSTINTELDAARKSALPAISTQQALGSTINSLQAEKESLKRELDSWKDRAKNLVSKFHQIDPEEHKMLISQVEELKKDKESLNAWKKTTEEENNRIRSIAKTLNQKNKEQKATIDSQQKDIENLNSEKATWATASTANSANTKELEDLKEKMTKMVVDAESRKRELEGANSRYDRLREKLREFQTMIRELRAKEKSLNEQLSIAQAAAAASLTKPPVTTQVANPLPSDTQDKQVVSVSAAPTSLLSSTENTLPIIPEEGFKFGPSSIGRSVGDKSELQKIPEASPLRVAAPAFVPIPRVADTSSSSVPAEALKSPIAVEPSSSESGKVADVASSDITSSQRSTPANKESSMKELLLAKKKELQKKILKRKQDAENVSPKPDTVEPVIENIPKRVKLENESTEKRAEGSETVLNSTTITNDNALTNTNDNMLTSTITDENTKLEIANEVEIESGEIKDDEKVQDTVVIQISDPSDAVDKESLSEPKAADTIQGFQSQSSPFAASTSSGNSSFGSTIFGQSTSFGTSQPTTFGSPSQPTTFGSPSQPTTFGSPSQPTTFGGVPNTTNTFGGIPATASTTTFGGAFLDMKPPGNSATAPTFTFGTSSSITLPTPSIPVPVNPFGAFGSGNNFGGFSSSSANSGTMPSMPLFGASPQQASKPIVIAIADDDEDVNDDEGEKE